MIDLSDPRLQKLIQKRFAMEYWGGIKGFAPEMTAFAGSEAKRHVQLGDVYLQNKMRDAHKEQMKFDTTMREKQLGLDTRMSNWRYDLAKDSINDRKKELDMSTILGLSTAAWSGYEGYRRKQLIDKDREETSNVKRRWKEMGLL